MQIPGKARYMRCSNIASRMGRMLDSTDRAMKNQSTPKDIILYLFEYTSDNIMTPVISTKAIGVMPSKKPPFIE
jgi:hypothetical protein